MSELHHITDVAHGRGTSIRLWFILVLVVVFSLCHVVWLPSAHAASYSLSPASGSYPVGQTFQVRVMVDSEGDAVNTGDGTITFDTNTLTAVSISKDGSPFNLWVTEPSISGGTITFAGGGTTPISGSKAIATITFRAKAEGTGSVEFSKATLLAGAGQNVLKGSGKGTYTVTPAVVAPPPEVQAPPQRQERTVNVTLPEAPEIKADPHKDPAEWYSHADVKFSWDIPFGVLGMKIGFSDSPDTEPSELHEPPISSWTKSGIKDGVWYFHASYRNRGGWGTSTSFKIQVDTTPPEPFEVTAIGGDLTAQLRFGAEDTLSGIALYRIAVDGGRSRDVQVGDLVAGGFTWTNLDPGDHSFKVTAIDKAGNEREAEAQTTVTGTKPVESAEGGVKTSGLGAIYWISLLFMAALAVVITMLVQERRKHTEEKDRLKREAAEAGDKLINVFGVLRDEIEEKVLELSHKPNMTDNERNILESLKDALDISEELIDKELEDVRKLLK